MPSSHSIVSAFAVCRDRPEWEQLTLGPEEEEGTAGGLSHGHREKASTSGAWAVGRVLWENSVGRVWLGRKEAALGTVEGPIEGDRAALRILKAVGIKRASQRNQPDYEVSQFSN